VLFRPSISLSFGVFIHPCFIPSFIHHALSILPSVIPTCLSSIFLSFSRVDHAAFGSTDFHVSMSHHSPPQLLSSAFIPPLSFSRVLSFLHQRLCRRVISSSSRSRLLPPSIASTSFRPFFTLLHSFPPSFFFHPSVLWSLSLSIFMARAHQMRSSSALSLNFSSTQRRF